MNEEKGIKITYPFKQLCEKYFIERGSQLKSAHVIRNKLDNIDRILGELATTSIYDFKPEDIIVRWRNKLILEVQSSTALREFAMFASVFSYAQKELFIMRIIFGVLLLNQAKVNQEIKELFQSIKKSL